MKRVGICAICGSVSNLNTCSLCGRLVCGSCFDHSRNVCKQCSSGIILSEMSSERSGLI
ncbi:orotate phosphoribosyltransferase [Methanolobus vulcani]|uniref:Orotate phosphoribosyltransferase n=1 Tax=Methanolobus vulcani TaxID=38026 RepID=A0A7Z8KP25_9EURY|nr:orotate phosphoribosyltransferase [Methanolobus vulcani]TQD26164.1 orotate phosphoribosyltransferase [Methanolobus vulcani]